MKKKQIEKEVVLHKLVAWMVGEYTRLLNAQLEEGNAPPFQKRYFSAWEIKDKIKEFGGNAGWWNGEFSGDLNKDLENFLEDIYLGYITRVGYFLTRNQEEAANWIVLAMGMMEGWANRLSAEILSAKDQARLEGVARALVSAGKSADELSAPRTELPKAIVREIATRQVLIGGPREDGEERVA